jgi:hypothetical protein
VVGLLTSLPRLFSGIIVAVLYLSAVLSRPKKEVEPVVV